VQRGGFALQVAQAFIQFERLVVQTFVTVKRLLVALEGKVEVEASLCVEAAKLEEDRRQRGECFIPLGVFGAQRFQQRNSSQAFFLGEDERRLTLHPAQDLFGSEGAGRFELVKSTVPVEEIRRTLHQFLKAKGGGP
jgi:hypothetical protein